MDPSGPMFTVLFFREALVYFSLACIAGIMTFCSCILGQYLSVKLAPSPTPYTSRAMSLRSRHSLHNAEYSQIQGPTHPMLGSWTRPATLKMDSKGTISSPWSVTLPNQRWGKQGMMEEEEQGSSYPWVFYDANTEQKKAVIYSQALYQRENINVV